MCRITPPNANYTLLGPDEKGMLPSWFVERAQYELKKTLVDHLFESCRTTIHDTLKDAERSPGLMGYIRVAVVEGVQGIPVSQLKKFVHQYGLRRIIGTPIISEEEFKTELGGEIRLLTEIFLAPNVCQLTKLRISKDDYRPVSDPAVHFNGVPVPHTLWVTFEKHLQRHIERSMPKNTPNLEAYLRSDLWLRK